MCMPSARCFSQFGNFEKNGEKTGKILVDKSTLYIPAIVHSAVRQTSSSCDGLFGVSSEDSI